MKPAAIYVRLSRVRKGEEAVSMETQERDCVATAQRLGFKPFVIREEGKSASEFGSGRPAWDELLRHLGSYGAVIAWKQDRLARDEEGWHRFVRLAGAAGVRIVTVADGTDIDPDDPDLLGPSVKSMVAAQESRNTSKRVKRALAERAERGDPHGGLRRYGYSRGDIDPETGRRAGTLNIIDTEAAIVREAARRLLEGESAATIAVDLDRRGVPTVTGARWRRVTLRGILTGPTVTGRRTHSSEPRWEPILDDETAGLVRTRLAAPRRGPVGTPGKRLLRGFAICGKCGAKLNGATRYGSKASDYVCPRPADGGCGGIRIAAAGFEAFVSAALIAAASTPEVRGALETDTDSRAALEDLSRALAKLEQRGNEIAADYGAGLIDRRTLLAAREANERERSAVERGINSMVTSPILSEAPRRPDSLTEWWKDASDARRRQLIGALLESITVGPGKRGDSRRFQHERVEVTWRAAKA